jgi:uncharacterized membrane protein SpoIIM required for sporulation
MLLQEKTMALFSQHESFSRHDLRMALLVTRREVRDSFRDWRIMIPILLLTLVFPLLANFTAQRMFGFTQRFGADIISERLLPFLLLIVGFFPMTFSLVIALETFVGEKERRSLEPLLVTPLTNAQLYLGKTMAALIPPLSASYLGMFVYLAGLSIIMDWRIAPKLMVQIFLLTLVQGIVMVSGAVIVSSQTTSVRAANLLASFIIVPMALMLQFEALLMFWGVHTDFLWWLIIIMSVTALILIRMGIHLFNREELLGRDMDQLRLGWLARKFWNRFSGRMPDGRYPTVRGWYRQLFTFMPQLKLPAMVLMATLLLASLLGALLSRFYPFPDTMLASMTRSQMVDNMSYLQLIAYKLPPYIILQNLRVLALSALLGLFTFGVMGIAIFILPWGLLSFLGGQLALAGEDPLLFMLGTIAPHATLELPALLLAGAAALRWHTTLIAPPADPNQVISERWLIAAADYSRVFVGLVLPLLFLAALVESYITPLVLVALYGAH